MTKLPITTEDKPYIEFRVDKKGKIKLSTSSNWWGKKGSGFVSSDGSEGFTCLPKDLESCIKAFKERKIKSIVKEINTLQQKLKCIKSEIDNWKFQQ